jgi:hypothetical protein
VATDDFETTMRRSFARNRQVGTRLNRHGRCRNHHAHRNPRIQKQRAIVIWIIEHRGVRMVQGMRVAVSAPVRMDGAAGMVRGCVVVGMRMDKWRCERGALNQHGQRDGYDLLHPSPSIVGNRGHPVKGTAPGAIATIHHGIQGRGIGVESTISRVYV